MKIRILRNIRDMQGNLIIKRDHIIEGSLRLEKPDWLVGCPVIEVVWNGGKVLLGEGYDCEEVK